jgi:RimJ/RimL family protein N-acetyltransferase
MFGPIVQGERVTLAPPRREDAELRQRWFADLEVTRLYTSPSVPSLAAEDESYERASRDPATVLWRIVVDERTIGQCFLCEIEWPNRTAQSGMWIGERSEWGKGYGSEAVRLRTRFAFHELGLQRLETSSFACNIGMHRALERSGYRRIGERHMRYFAGGEWHDEIIFELLAKDWREH